jgi:D-alanine-D-alanine ligase
MANDQRIKLGIIFGGRSGEYEVSLTSAASVINALNPAEFEIIAIGITQTGKLANPSELRGMLPSHLLPRIQLSPAIENCDSRMGISASITGTHEQAHGAPQIFFPLLHGPYGEDGTIQGLMEMAGVPYIGCGVLASAVAMDKDIAKILFTQAGLPVTPSKTIYSQDLAKNLDSIREEVSSKFGYPLFSKPANLGSSVGVHKIHNANEFKEALLDSAQYDRKILIEKGIDGRELECAILGNDNPLASVVGEVISAGEFYDYESKYSCHDSRLDIPAHIEEKQSEEIRNLAVRAFKAIDGSGLARVDFFLERSSNRIWINEINTMPGFTPISMYSKLWAASGLSFEQLVRRLIRLGEERFQERNNRKVSIK